MEYNISTHAPRAGSDAACCVARSINPYFNPRSPCGERRLYCRFLQAVWNFNPRSPCGERRY